MNPGDRPRNPYLLKVIGGAVAVTAVAALVVVADTDTAAAGELERFASCEALGAWGEGASATAGGSTGVDGADEDAGMAAGAPNRVATEGAAPGDAAQGGDAQMDTASGRALAETDDSRSADGTNVAVEGVDELDVVDRVDDEHVLVAAAARLSIVDVVEHRVVANVPVASTVEATYDAERGIAWVAGPDDESGRLTITRVAVTPTSLAVDATWSTDGWLVDARRVEDRLYVVASDGYGDDVVPFASQPVPCDEVLHPIGRSDPTATLVVALPATGALEPEHAAQVVGSGEHVHVTTDAAYLATPLYGDTVQTSFHRFDLADLRLTGSGRVDGSILSQFSMSDFAGHLRVAVTDQGGGFGRGIEGDDVAIDVAPGRPAPVLGPLNEVVVLDTDGDLDVVGRTPRFGHDGETIQGVRFVGEVAYAVTFLQTDPFYVLDLADPAAPTVVGDVELPGFSSYLHPVADGLVAGFGPDEDGRVAVKLFDVSDRSNPTVVDTVVLGDESPVAWDHHAFVDLGDGRFAVPASTYRELHPAGCTAERQAQLRTEEARINGEMSVIYDGSKPEPADAARLRELEAQAGELHEDGCLSPRSVPESSVVVLDASGGRLELVQRLGAVRSPMSATRVVQTDGGWALLAGNHWIVLDGSGDQAADLELGPEPTGGPYPTDFGRGPAGGGTGLVIE